MGEKVLTFGEANRLVGLLTAPDNNNLKPSTPAVVFLNAGMLHHVGPFRLYVDLARRLADVGFVSLRIDIGGLGDSQQARNPKHDLEQAILDIRLAMDALEKKLGRDRFILVGLCTGAANAFRTAVADRRVVGCCLLSGYAYPTIRFYLHRYGPIVFSRTRIIKTLARFMRKIAGSLNRPAVTSNDRAIGWWILPQKEQFVSECKGLFERNVQILSIFTGGDSYYQYQAQLHDTLVPIKPGNKLTTFYNRKADHTYSDVTFRANLVVQVTSWITEHF